MKIVQIIGGLGNQMFQYALAVSLKHRFPQENIKIDITHFRTYELHNGFELARIFGIKLETAGIFEIRKARGILLNYIWRGMYRRIFHNEIVQRGSADFMPEVFQAGKSLYYEGYWQHWKYFEQTEQVVREAFTFPPFTDRRNAELYDRMESDPDSVCIHIRRGDYLKPENRHFQGLCGESYYLHALDEIRNHVKHGHFYIFSDDSVWCREFFRDKLLPEETIDFIDWNTGTQSYCDMQLMTAASHMIIANSSFSWMSAFLNRKKSKTVIAPEQWLTTVPPGDRQPPEWILMK